MLETVQEEALQAEQQSAVHRAAEFLASVRPDDMPRELFVENVITAYGRLEERRDAIGNSAAIDRALKRGALLRKIMEEEEGGSRSSEQVAEFLGITRQAVDQRRKARKLIAWPDEAGHWRFPVWQFDTTGRVYRDLPAILEELPSDPWSDMTFFLSESETLKARPLDLLRRGQAKRIRLAAMRFGRQGA
jgi:hypothetical protein